MLKAALLDLSFLQGYVTDGSIYVVRLWNGRYEATPWDGWIVWPDTKEHLL